MANIGGHTDSFCNVIISFIWVNLCNVAEYFRARLGPFPLSVDLIGPSLYCSQGVQISY